MATLARTHADVAHHPKPSTRLPSSEPPALQEPVCAGNSGETVAQLGPKVALDRLHAVRLAQVGMHAQKHPHLLLSRAAAVGPARTPDAVIDRQGIDDPSPLVMTLEQVGPDVVEPPAHAAFLGNGKDEIEGVAANADQGADLHEARCAGEAGPVALRDAVADEAIPGSRRLRQGEIESLDEVDVVIEELLRQQHIIVTDDDVVVLLQVFGKHQRIEQLGSGRGWVLGDFDRARLKTRRDFEATEERGPPLPNIVVPGAPEIADECAGQILPIGHDDADHEDLPGRRSRDSFETGPTRPEAHAEESKGVRPQLADGTGKPKFGSGHVIQDPQR